MKILAERIISYLRSDTTLVTLLGSVNNIVASGLAEGDNRKQKFINVPIDPGEDLNYANGQQGEFILEVVVSRKIAGSVQLCVEIADRVDTLLNKGEVGISNTSWKIVHLKRLGSPTKGPLIDKEAGEVYMSLEYEYILSEE